MDYLISRRKEQMPLLFYLNFSSFCLISVPLGPWEAYFQVMSKSTSVPRLWRSSFFFSCISANLSMQSVLAAGQALARTVLPHTRICLLGAHSGLLSSGGAFSEHSPSRFSAILPISSFVTLWLHSKH